MYHTLLGARCRNWTTLRCHSQCFPPSVAMVKTQNRCSTGRGKSEYLYLYSSLQQKYNIYILQTENMQYIYVFTEAGIYFSGIDFLREKILDACNAANFKIPVVLDCKKVSGLDFTAIRGLHILAEDLHKKDVLLILTNMEDTLQNNIDTAKHVSICTKEFPLKEILIQENIQKGRYNFHLGYTSVEPEVKVES